MGTGQGHLRRSRRREDRPSLTISQSDAARLVQDRKRESVKAELGGEGESKHGGPDIDLHAEDVTAHDGGNTTEVGAVLTSSKEGAGVGTVAIVVADVFQAGILEGEGVARHSVHEEHGFDDHRINRCIQRGVGHDIDGERRNEEMHLVHVIEANVGRVEKRRLGIGTQAPGFLAEIDGLGIALGLHGTGEDKHHTGCGKTEQVHG